MILHCFVVAVLSPNQPCPCGSETKYKKCCCPFIEGTPIDSPNRLVRCRYVALINRGIAFLWNSLHPFSPIRQNQRQSRFEDEQKSLSRLQYKSLQILDEREISADETRIVQYVTVWDEGVDLSYIEESVLRRYEGAWYYFDGLRRSSSRIGCVPESVRVGELATLFVLDSEKN